MPNYVEQATLEVIDRSSGPVKAINAELRKLAATANALKGALASVKMDTAALSKASAHVRSLRAEMKALATTGAIKPTIDLTGLRSAVAEARKATTEARKATGALVGLPATGLRTAGAAGAALAEERARIAAGREVVRQVQAEARAREVAARAATRAAEREAAAQTRAREVAARAATRAAEREAADQVRAQRAADEASARSLRQRLGYWRQTSPVLADLRAQAGEQVRSTRADARAAVRQMVEVRAVGAESIGSRIGNAFTSLATGAAHEIGQRMAYGLAEAAKKGYTQQDIAQTKLRIQGLSEAERAAVNVESMRLAKGSDFNAGQVAGLFAENLNTAAGDFKAASALTQSALKIADRQVELGASREKAIEEAYKFQKAGEQTGRLTDATGKIDPAKVEAWTNFMLKAQAAIGEEFSAGFVEKAVKYLRGSKYTLNDPGLLKAFLLNEESGSTASVGINQAIKQLSGIGLQKRALNELVAQGLITTKEVKSGTEGGKKRTTTVVDTVVGEDLLRQDPGAYIEKYIAPKFKALGLDINNPVDVSKYANSIASDRTSVEAISGFINRLQELKLQVDRALGNAVAVDTQASKAASGTAAFGAALNKVDGVVGAVGKSLDGVLIPAARGVSSVLDGLTAYVIGDGTGKGAAGRGLAVTGGAGALGGAGLYGLFRFNPLSASAAQLNVSASALKGAAASLSAAAGKRGAADLITPGGAAKTAAAEVVAGAPKRGSGLLSLGKKALGGAGVGLAIGAVEFALTDDRAEGLGRMIGSAAGGAIGNSAGPVGVLLGTAIGAELGGYLAKTDIGRTVAEAIVNAAKGVKETFTGEKPLSPYDAHAKETLNAALEEVAKVKSEIAAIEAKRKGGYLSPEDQTIRDNLGFKLKGAEERLSTYTVGAIDSIAALGNAAAVSASAITSADIAKQAGEARRRRLEETIEARDSRTRSKKGRVETALKDGAAAYPDPRAAALHDATTAKAAADAYARLTRAEKDRADYLAASKLKGPERAAAIRQAAINSQNRAEDERRAAVAAPFATEAARASASAAMSSREAAQLLAIAARTTGTTSGLATTAADTIRLFGATGSSVGRPGGGGPALGGDLSGVSARGWADSLAGTSASFAATFDESAGLAAQAFIDGGSSAASAMAEAFASGGAAAAEKMASAIASATATINVNTAPAPSAGPAAPAPTGRTSPN